jgi:hypothetical protein
VTLPIPTPGSALDATLGRAQALLAEGDGAQALSIMQAAALAAPDNAAVMSGLGVALRFNGQLEDAALAFSRAIEQQPRRADAKVHLGMIRLAQGRQKEGWPLYAARWQHPHWTEKLRYPAASLWLGQVTPGMRLLLWGEQGYGDILQFCRYAPWLLRALRAQGASLALEVPVPLCGLLRAAWPFMDVLAAGAARGRFDAHLPLMDLPHRYGDQVGDGGLPYMPMPHPYLSALPDPLATRRGALFGGTPQDGAPPLRVGIAWQGRATHPDDRWRSIRPEQLQALFDVPGVRWVSLQKDAGPSGAHPSWLPDEMAQCRDFSDTARILDGLDLVVSIDSALAHLAGALGKPVWLLLPKVADWRWGLSGDTTPWYPGMRLLRQGAAETWPRVAARAGAALAALVQTRKPP